MGSFFSVSAYEPKKVNNLFFRSGNCNVQWKFMINEAEGIFQLSCNYRHHGKDMQLKCLIRHQRKWRLIVSVDNVE